jgi:hypothetical protein
VIAKLLRKWRSRQLSAGQCPADLTMNWVQNAYGGRVKHCRLRIQDLLYLARGHFEPLDDGHLLLSTKDG